MVSHGRFSSQVFDRSPQNIRRDELDHYGLFVQGNGTRVIQSGRHTEVMLHPGDIYIHDLAQPTRSFATTGTSGTLYLPRELVEEVIPQFSRFHSTILQGNATRLLVQHVLTMGRYFPEMPATAANRLFAATRELALACMVEHVEGLASPQLPLDPDMRRQVERYVEGHLGDPDLCAISISAAFGISRSTLYRMFEIHAGVAGFIKERRLLRVRAILQANRDSRPIVEIALDSGFRTAAHFSREFRNAFGISPSQARAGGTVTAGNGEGQATMLDHMFRTLHAGFGSTP